MKEIWKDIPEYEGLYQISNIGNIKAKARAKTHKKDKIMISTIKKYGYKEIGFMKKGIRKIFQIHRLVAEVFIPNKENFKSMPDEDRTLVNLNKLEVNHKDENASNNSVDNLEWCTHKYNSNYGNLRKKRKEIAIKNNHICFLKHSIENSKKEIIQYDNNGKTIKIYKSIRDASRDLNINSGRICEMCKGKRSQYKGYRFKYSNEVMPND